MYLQLLFDFQVFRSKLDGCCIPINTQPGNYGSCLVTEEALVPKVFPCMHVAYVKLDKWNIDPEQGIADGNAGVGESSRIDDDGIDALSWLTGDRRCNQLAEATCFLDAIDDGAFMIGLKSLQLNSKSCGLRRCGERTSDRVSVP